MQTFLPYPSFLKSLQCLDDKRLGKQRSEAATVLKINQQGPWIAYNRGHTANPQARTLLWHKPLDSGVGIINTPWYNHPAVRMWWGYEYDLTLYHDCAIRTWKSRGFNNNMKCLIDPIYYAHDILIEDEYPPWLTESFCASHRSNLLRKNPKFYGQYGWKEPPNLPYIWPV